MSRICRPMESTGFREVIGSWKTTEISWPRICRRRRVEARVTSSPSSVMRPAGMVAFSGRSCRSALISVDLPQPDSPTTPTIWPSGTVIDTSRSAWSAPSRVS
jgi:hypothetical protein